MTVTTSSLNIGIVGAGGFATFAAHCFSQIAGVRIVAVADANPAAATSLGEAHGATVYTDFSLLLAETLVDLVYIATPPAFHYPQSKAALLAGRHVICEKPAALAVTEAEELVDLAKSMNILYVVNLMQRYNPLYHLVKEIIQSNILGEFTHGYFENYASDEYLPHNHWFWDATLSGGIFIEHGVHFFDLFAGWIGQGELIHSAKWRRPDMASNIYDRVQAIVNHDKGPVTYYHGFDQPKILDRQELRLQFERGDITLYGWIPVRLKLNGLLDQSGLKAIGQLFESLEVSGNQEYESPILTIHGLESLAGDPRLATGRFKTISYTEYLTVDYGDDAKKMSVYADLLEKILRDQWSWIIDQSVERITTGHNAIESLRISEQATLLAKTY